MVSAVPQCLKCMPLGSGYVVHTGPGFSDDFVSC